MDQASSCEKATKIDNKKKIMIVSWKEDTSFIGYQYKAALSERGLKGASIYTVNKKSGKKLGNWLQVSTSQKFVVVQVRAIYKDSNGKRHILRGQHFVTWDVPGCQRHLTLMVER